MSGHRMHGPTGTNMPADWPALTPAEITALLAHYPQAGQLQAIRWRSPRPLSAAALLDTSRGRLFVKRHHRSVRSPATLAEEHAFIAHLRAAGLAVPAVLLGPHGHSAVAIGDWVYELQCPIDGLDLYRELESWQPLTCTAHAREAGRTLARLHQAAAGYQAPQRQTHVLVSRDELLCADDPLRELRRQLPQRPGLAAWLGRRDWQRDFGRAIVPRQQHVQARAATQPRLWCHNDWHASNLAWSDPGEHARIRSVFDFGLASPTFALFDLATAIERNAIAWLQLPQTRDIAHPASARALIEGYREVAPLNSQQLELLADLLPVIHLDFALSELEYFHAITRSPKNADIAWHDFLLGHADWFHSQPAQHLQASVAAA